jgi:hypothetical protein
MRDYYFDGDSVDLTDEQRSTIESYYKSNYTVDDFWSACKSLIATAADRSNKVSVAMALAAMFRQEDGDPGSGDQYLKGGSFTISALDELDVMSNDGESELDDTAFEEHWQAFKSLVTED